MRKLVIVILFLLPIIVNAQTRFYFDRLTVAPISPTINAAWTITTGNTFHVIFPSKSLFPINTGNGTLVSATSTTTSPQKMICATFISTPLTAQTISNGTVFSMQMRGSKSSSLSTGLLTIYVRLCDAAGTTITEIGNFSNATNLVAGTSSNRTLTVTVSGDVTVNFGDRLIVEVGESFTAGATAHTCTINVQVAPSVADLPVDNTSTSLLNPWIESSQTLTFVKLSGIF